MNYYRIKSSRSYLFNDSVVFIIIDGLQVITDENGFVKIEIKKIYYTIAIQH